MSGAGKVLGSSTVSSGVGVAILPNTGGNLLLKVLSISIIAIGVMVVVSFTGTRLYARLAR